MDVSLTVFEILTYLARKWLVFPTPPLFDAPCGGTPYDINVIYTQLKSTFNGLTGRREGVRLVRSNPHPQPSAVYM